MLKQQKQYLSFLELAKSSLSEVGHSTSEVEAALEKIENLELIIPMVGSFSAGKSTISNTLMGKNTLPVAVTPETDLAAELRYSLDERVEAVRKNGTFEVFDIGGFESLKSKSTQFEYLRVYVTNDFIKEISPLVLVDMPGFDSTLEAHNKAIFRYIARGSHYIVLVSSEEGTLPRSVLENLEHIDITNQSLTIFMSKADLRSPEDTELLTNQIRGVAQDFLNYSDSVLPISYKQPELLKQALQSIDSEELFEQVSGQYIKHLSIDIIQPLALKEASLKSDAEREQKAIQQLDENLKNIEEGRDESLQKLKKSHTNKLVQKCKHEVEQALMPQLVSMSNQLASGNHESVKSGLANSVRNTVVRTLDAELRKISDKAIEITVSNFNGVGEALSDLGVKSNWEATVTESIQGSFNNVSQSLEKLGGGLKMKKLKMLRLRIHGKKPIA